MPRPYRDRDLRLSRHEPLQKSWQRVGSHAGRGPDQEPPPRRPPQLLQPPPPLLEAPEHPLRVRHELLARLRQPHPPARPPHPPPPLLEAPEPPLRVRHELLARIRQPHPPARPDEQLVPYLLLERLQPRRQGRLREKHLLRRPAQVPEARHRQKTLELSE